MIILTIWPQRSNKCQNAWVVSIVKGCGDADRRQVRLFSVVFNYTLLETVVSLNHHNKAHLSFLDLYGLPCKVIHNVAGSSPYYFDWTYLSGYGDAATNRFEATNFIWILKTVRMKEACSIMCKSWIGCWMWIKPLRHLTKKLFSNYVFFWIFLV